MTLDDRKLGILALLFAAFLTWAGHDLEAPFSYEPIGPKVFPLLVAAVMALCGVLLVIKGGNRVPENAAGANSRIWLMVFILTGYAILFQWLGFTLATALMTVLVGRLFGASWLFAAAGGIGLGLLLYGLFDKVLDVVLPVGLLGAFL